MRKNSALVLFAYKRPSSTLEQLKNLRGGKTYDICIYLDNSKSPEFVEINNYLQGITDIEVIVREDNYGLQRNIEEGLDRITELYENFCVLEDDMIVTREDVEILFESMSRSVSFEVSGFPLGGEVPITIPLGSSWFWGMKSVNWKDFRSWEFRGLSFSDSLRIDYSFRYPFLYMLRGHMQGKVNSWAIIKHVYMIQNELTCTYVSTSFSFVENIGNGTNSDDYLDVKRLGGSWQSNLLLLSKSNNRIKNFIKWLVGFWYLLFRGFIFS